MGYSLLLVWPPGGDSKVVRPGVGWEGRSVGWLTVQGMALVQPTAGKPDRENSLRNRLVAGARAQGRLQRSGVFDTHERAVACLEQKLRIDESAEERSA